MASRKYRSISHARNIDKPTAKKVFRGIPELEILDDNPDRPVLVEKHRPHRAIRVDGDDILTLHLGMHTRSRPKGIGAFSKECLGICTVPTAAAKMQSINALFLEPEIAPAAFMDSIVLWADVPFRLTLIKDSIKLEKNGPGKIWALGDEAISEVEDSLVIDTKSLAESIENYYDYTYDFITITVRVTYE